MNKTTKTMCTYCEEVKQCTNWQQTNEMVCYDCRLDLLDAEFFSKKEYKSYLFPDLDTFKFPSIKK